jgi:transcription elongation factor Elf1
MDAGHSDVPSELAADAALERKDFLVQSATQLHRFLEANADRIAELGGMTLIDDEPDYLSIAPDLTFRSRSRYLDDATGQWVSETEVIESPSELVELYNPADIFSAFADAAREAAGMAEEPTAAGELMEMSGAQHGAPIEGTGVYAEAADEWAAGQGTPIPLEADDEEIAARQLYDLALDFQERSQRSESRLLEQFQTAASNLSARLGDLIIVDDEDERLTLEAGGLFRAEVQPEETQGQWTTLATPEDLVEYYDPTDVFGDLADAIAEAYPSVAPEENEDHEDHEDREDRDDGDGLEDDAGEGAEPR